ncbi:flagellar basal body L-ring protein FlgH [Candidatus Liberibacter africanus]|uniref:Flagellar L-ring protein n=1 Tax=Candidatus Liberibacter africanus PTSAPSY TaxID=1277257 RepID=A0A0G3I291_LIBAF|nr:flagellar basal body L-ring protein FlgH [Candidatus Liberibacter africanus]AKK19976.1 flagellar basal body L-ring protein [Candidatus Liberibacter africanus PTSAPSY]QTP64384.1 flagellar basal body L-ring protein FlgH [Candidatus Liberibacter africanus]
MYRYSFIVLNSVFLLFGCHFSGISEMISIPQMSPMGSSLHKDNRSILSGIHFKNPRATKKSYSLWRDSHSTLFKDSRALSVGDILTVDIRIDDQAVFDNRTGRSRNNSLDRKLSGGFSIFNKNSPSIGGNLNYDGNSSSSGKGSISRAEKLNLLIAAIVIEILDNGNLIISGSQEVRVNDEIRSLNVTGIVRPQDVDAHNSVSYDKIAEARISYGGNGRTTEVLQPPIGHKLVDKFSPL